MQVVIGTAGHIDHGKTSIVKALTGKNTDNLIEEKNRGMTIDLGFAYLDEKITIIDVPGHERFIKNMVAGVSTVHIGLLVIAADDGIMPQTYEHIEILNFLNVKHVIVALNKIDIVDDEWIELVEKDINSLINEMDFLDSKIVKTSAQTNQGISVLSEEIKTMSNKISQKEKRDVFYLPIDRVFSKVGYGTIVTGTVISGKSKVGDSLVALPGNHNLVVRSLQSHGKMVESVKQGDRAALNFSNIDRMSLQRGMVVSQKNKINTSSTIIINVKMSTRTQWKLKNKQSVHVHIGTKQTIAKVVTYGRTLRAGDSANVVLITKEPIVFLNDQFFILRSLSPMETIAGCKVLDHDFKHSKKELKNILKSIDFDLTQRIIQSIHLRSRYPFSVNELSRRFNLSSENILTIAQSDEVIHQNGLIFSKSNLNKIKHQLLVFLENFHKQNPYKRSIALEELARKLDLERTWLDLIVSELRSEVEKVDGGLSLPGKDIVFKDLDKKIAEDIDNKIKFSEYSLVSAKDLNYEDSKKTLEILHVLKNQGKIFQVDNEYWIHESSKKSLLQQLLKYFANQETLSVSDFKSITSTTRKNAIPLLEFCDKNNFTQREGNLRVKGDCLHDQ